MRYHYKKPNIYSNMYGQVYKCNHPVYSKCTLYKIGDKDEWLVDSIYLSARFKSYFDERAGLSDDGIYPTVTIRQIMWALKMKPIPKERWETVFDRKCI